MNMENNLIATRYCLDNETEKSYSDMFKESGAWRCGLIDPDRLLKLPKYYGKPCLDGGSVNFYQREGDMDNLPKSTITYTNELSTGELTEIFMKQPIQVQEFPTTEQSVEKLCEELKK